MDFGHVQLIQERLIMQDFVAIDFTFPEVWAQIKDRLAGGLSLAAHNRPFDESCLKAAFEEYGLEYLTI